MTLNENRQRIKNEAPNKIRKMYHPKYKFPYSQYQEDGSGSEQKEDRIRMIIKNMERELEKSKAKES